MLRRGFLTGAAASLAFLAQPHTTGDKLAEAARKQLGLTTGYDPKYTRIPYPNGDVPRTTGVCADVIIRAARDALKLDLQQLVHEDMIHNFADYPRTWNLPHPDPNIDHRRVLNLEVFWTRANTRLWAAQGAINGNDFPGPLQPGDLLTWLLDARLPHVGIVVETGLLSTKIVHNIGNGVEESTLFAFRTQHAKGHYRWPTA